MCDPPEIMARRPEARLLWELRSRDPCALAEVDRRHRAALRAHAARMLGGSGVDPDDLVQDTLLRAWVHPPGSNFPLEPWLHVVARNRGLDLLKSPAVRRRDELPAELAGAGADPAREAEARDALRAVVEGLSSLPERQARALVLHALEGAGHAEIARRLGTTEGGARQLVHRARRRLAEGAGSV